MKHLYASLVKKGITLALILGLVVPQGALAFGGGAEFMAATTKEALCQGATSNNACSTNGPTLMGTIGTITNILLYILGAISVIMIIVGAIRYVTSSGDQNAATGAKNTIMYALIGLVVAVAAYAIVNFVISNIAPSQGPPVSGGISGLFKPNENATI